MPKILHPHFRGRTAPDSSKAAESPVTLPLSRVAPGERAYIVQVEQGRRFRKRLADLGLAVGMEVRVLHGSRWRGPMILAVRHDARIAVGWGVANKIWVRLD